MPYQGVVFEKYNNDFIEASVYIYTTSSLEIHHSILHIIEKHPISDFVR
jgi:hypothetical protein